MMAHNPSQPLLIKKRAQEEGNYASIAFSHTRDQETDHGLTLLPKIQSSDSWLFDAAHSIGIQDFEALLGPVQFDLVEADVPKEDSGVETLFNVYQLSGSPAKRRRLTRELSKEPLAEAELKEPAVCKASPSASSGNANQTARPVLSLEYELLESQSSSASISKAPDFRRAVGLLGQGDEQPSLTAGTKNGREFAIEANNEGPGQQCIDCHDGGSLFEEGCSTEGSAENPPATKQLGVDDDAEARSIVLSTAPMESRDPDLPIPSIERDSPFRERQPRRLYALRHFKIPRFSKRDAVQFAIQNGLFSLDGKRCEPCMKPSSQNFVGQGPKRTSPHKQISSTFQYSRKSLPLSIAFALASPVHKHSIEQIVKKTRAIIASKSSGYPVPSTVAPHEVPDQLSKLFDNLQSKFNNDENFRKSTLTWVLNNMSSIQSSSDYGDSDTENSSNYYDHGHSQPEATIDPALLAQERSDTFETNQDLQFQIQSLEAMLDATLRRVQDLESQVFELSEKSVSLEWENRNLHALLAYYQQVAQSVPSQARVLSSETNRESTNTSRHDQTRKATPANHHGVNQYWICALPKVGQPEDSKIECGAVNQKFHKYGAELSERRRCGQCFRINLEARRYISEAEANAKGGCVVTNKIKRTLSKFRKQPTEQFLLGAPTQSSTPYDGGKGYKICNTPPPFIGASIAPELVAPYLERREMMSMSAATDSNGQPNLLYQGSQMAYDYNANGQMGTQSGGYLSIEEQQNPLGTAAMGLSELEDAEDAFTAFTAGTEYITGHNYHSTDDYPVQSKAQDTSPFVAATVESNSEYLNNQDFSSIPRAYAIADVESGRSVQRSANHGSLTFPCFPENTSGQSSISNSIFPVQIANVGVPTFAAQLSQPYNSEDPQMTRHTPSDDVVSLHQSPEHTLKRRLSDGPQNESRAKASKFGFENTPFSTTIPYQSQPAFTNCSSLRAPTEAITSIRSASEDMKSLFGEDGDLGESDL